MGVALVGLGQYTTGELMPALKETKNCYLAGLVSGSREKLDRYKTEFGLQDHCIYSYEDFDAIADNDQALSPAQLTARLSGVAGNRGPAIREEAGLGAGLRHIETAHGNQRRFVEIAGAAVQAADSTHHVCVLGRIGDIAACRDGHLADGGGRRCKEASAPRCTWNPVTASASASLTT